METRLTSRMIFKPKVPLFIRPGQRPRFPNQVTVAVPILAKNACTTPHLANFRVCQAGQTYPFCVAALFEGRARCRKLLQKDLDFISGTPLDSFISPAP